MVAVDGREVLGEEEAVGRGVDVEVEEALGEEALGEEDSPGAGAVLAEVAQEEAGKLCTRKRFPNICITTISSRRFTLPNTKPLARFA